MAEQTGDWLLDRLGAKMVTLDTSPASKPRKSAREETRRLHNMWLDGYQRAAAVLRERADEFGDEQFKQAVLVCADMIEAAKPTPEMIEDATFGDQHDQ